MTRSLNGMVVLITGASAGIGRTLAEQLDRRGAKLALAARRLDVLEQLNRGLGGAHLCVRADVSKRGDCEELVTAAVQRFGRLDTLVCNAGFGVYRRIDQLDPDEVRQLFATNVFGTTDCIAAALPRMKQQPPRDGWRGQIMIVSSAAGRRGVPYIGMYSATKAAQLALTDALRVELHPDRIAVTGVYPVQTRTEFSQVAQDLGGKKIAHVGSFSQTVEHVATRMLRAIERPCAEVWPSRATKWMLGLGAVFPGLTDRVMRGYLRRVEAENHSA